MAKELQVGNYIYNYPENGEEAGWGEGASDWAEAITDQVNTLSGPNNIPTTSFSFANNQAIKADIVGMAFNVSGGGVLAVEIDYMIKRVYDSGVSTSIESGKIIGMFDGSIFTISQEALGNAGFIISVTNAGQFQYTSTDLANPTENTIKFKAQTIDQ